MISYKIVLVGDFGSGKTSLIKRYVDNSFSDDYKSSIGVSISKKVLDIKIDDVLYETTMMIWDIEGKTDFKPIFHHHLNGSKGFVVVADLTRQTTIDSLYEHIKLCKTICKDAPIVVALNKRDLYSNEVDLDALKQSFDEEIIGIFKTSAKDTSYVKELFGMLNLEIVKSIKK